MAKCETGCVMKSKNGDIVKVNNMKIATCSVCGTIYKFCDYHCMSITEI